jgi:hypothetical protein
MVFGDEWLKKKERSIINDILLFRDHIMDQKIKQ